VGKMVAPAQEAAELLSAQGVEASVWDVRCVKPLDQAMLIEAARYPLVVTVEDGIKVGGVGTAIAASLGELDEQRHSPPVLILGPPPEYTPQGKPAQILSMLGLDGPGIAAAVLKTVPAIGTHAPA